MLIFRCWQGTCFWRVLKPYEMLLTQVLKCEHSHNEIMYGTCRTQREGSHHLRGTIMLRGKPGNESSAKNWVVNSEWESESRLNLPLSLAEHGVKSKGNEF